MVYHIFWTLNFPYPLFHSPAFLADYWYFSIFESSTFPFSKTPPFFFSSYAQRTAQSFSLPTLLLLPLTSQQHWIVLPFILRISPITFSVPTSSSTFVAVLKWFLYSGSFHISSHVIYLLASLFLSDFGHQRPKFCLWLFDFILPTMCLLGTTLILLWTSRFFSLNPR